MATVTHSWNMAGYLTARRTTPVQLPSQLGWRRDLRLGVEEGVGMELSLVRGLGEAGAKLAQTSCAGQRLPSVGASRGHRKDPPAFY